MISTSNSMVSVSVVTDSTQQVKQEINKEFDISIFEIDKTKGMVNLTKIAKHFNAEVKEWKKLKGTQDYLKAYSDITEKAMGEIITSLKGGDLSQTEQGTWAERKIAIRFMQWIKPEFAVWADFQLDKLFSEGTVSIKPPQTHIETLRELLKTLEDNEALQLQLTETTKTLEHKQSVIVDLTKNVPAKEMRSKINEVVRYYSKDYADNWTTLYREFGYRYKEEGHGIHLKTRAENRLVGRRKDKPMKTLDYAEDFGYLKDLYLLALELFEKKHD